MKKPYIFGHRGAMGYCIENTIPSFKKAIEMKAGIETDVRLTKDNLLVCFHDPGFKINNKWYTIKKLTYDELQDIEFQDKRCVPLFEDIYQFLKDDCQELRFSCDIGDKKAGIKLINIARKYNILDKIEITEIKIRILKQLRDYEPNTLLVFTVPHNQTKINKNTIDFDILHDLKVKAINIKNERAKYDHFKTIVDNGFSCYVWGVNTKHYMKKTLQLKYKDEIVDAIYSNYPDILFKLREQIFD